MKTALLLLSLYLCTVTVLAIVEVPSPPPCWHPLLNATLRAAQDQNTTSAPVMISVKDSVSMFMYISRVDGTVSLDWMAEVSLTAHLSLNYPTLQILRIRQVVPVLLQCAADTLNKIQQQQQDQEIKQLSDCAQLVVTSFGQNLIGRSEMRDFVSLIKRVISTPPPTNSTRPPPTTAPPTGALVVSANDTTNGTGPGTGPGPAPGPTGPAPGPVSVANDAALADIAAYFIRLFGNVNFNATGTIIGVDAEAGFHFFQRLKLCDVLVSKPSVPPQYGVCVHRVIDASRVLVDAGLSLNETMNRLKVAFDSDVESRQRSGLGFNFTASIIASLNSTLPQLNRTWIDIMFKCVHEAEQPIQPPPSQSGIPGAAATDDSDPICEINCPNNLICIGNLCVPPRPKCDRCTSSPSFLSSDLFCFVSVNVTLLSRFNAYAYASTRARRSGETYQRPLDTEFGFRYGIDITARGDYRGVCISRIPTIPQCANQTHPEPCPQGDICTASGCRTCELCAGNGRPGDNSTRIPDDVTDKLVRAGLDLSGFVRVDTRVNNTREGGDVSAVQGAFQQIGSDVRNLLGLVFQRGQDGANSSQQTAIQLARGSQLMIQQIIQAIPSAPVAVVVDGNASFSTNRVELRQDTTFTILLGGRDSRGRCDGNASLNGALTIQGSSDISDNSTSGSGQVSSGGSWNFPPRRQDVIAGADAVVNVAGAVALAGDISNATLNVIAIATARAIAVIANGARFATSGRVLGDTGLIYVRGALLIETTLVQPELVIESGGNVTLDAGNTQTGFLGGSLNISANGQLNLRSNGTATNFSTFAECAATATLVVTVDSLVTVRVPGTRGVLFRFSSIGQLGIRYACRVRLIDSQNNTLDLINRNQPANSRRLLEDGQTEVVFTQNEVAYATSNDTTSTNTTAPPTGTGGAGGTTAAPTTAAPTTAGTTSAPTTSAPTTNDTTTATPTTSAPTTNAPTTNGTTTPPPNNGTTTPPPNNATSAPTNVSTTSAPTNPTTSAPTTPASTAYTNTITAGTQITALAAVWLGIMAAF